MFFFSGGWRFSGGRAEWTDWCLPVIGGRAHTWWRGGEETGGGENGMSVWFPEWSCKSLFSDICPAFLIIYCFLFDFGNIVFIFLQPLPMPTLPPFSPSIPIPSTPGCSSALSATPLSHAEDKQQVFPLRLANNTTGKWSQTLLQFTPLS